LTVLHEAEALAATLNDEARLGRITAYMTRHFFLLGQQDQAIACGERALQLASAEPDLHVATHLYLGYAYHALGNYQRAIDVLQRNMACLAGPLRYEHFGLAPLPAVSSAARLAQCLAELGEFAAGIRYGTEALDIAETAAHPFSLNQACRGLGIVYLRQGAFDTAIALLARGLALCQDADLPLEFPIIASALGTAYVRTGRLTEALPLLEQAVEQAVVMQRLDQHALRLAALSEGYLCVARRQEALPLAHEALERARAAGERGAQAYVLRLLGALASAPEDAALSEAERSYRQAMGLANDLGMRPLLGLCHLELGTLYSRLGRRHAAQAMLTTAVTMFGALHMPFWHVQAQAALTRLR
jgi:tetratricopeptide (TPR) repeat protein